MQPNLYILAGGLILMAVICFAGPLAALADVHPMESSVKQSCGPLCVIETVKCDTKREADYWAETHQSSKATAPYQLKGSDVWFVDYQVTELEANEL